MMTVDQFAPPTPSDRDDMITSGDDEDDGDDADDDDDDDDDCDDDESICRDNRLNFLFADAIAFS